MVSRLGLHRSVRSAAMPLMDEADPAACSALTDEIVAGDHPLRQRLADLREEIAETRRKQ